MNKDAVRKLIEDVGIIPAIRVSSTDDALFAAEAVASSGIPIVEITMTVPGALSVISELAKQHPSMAVGAGTVLNIDAARRCLDAGASFLTSPIVQLDVIEYGKKRHTVVFPGAATPTEIVTAWQAGSDFVKLFPCAPLGGPAYLKALTSPFPDIPFIASGGVNQHNAAQFLLAGARALGIGNHLVDPEAISRRERDWIRELSRRYLQMVREARGQKQPE